MSAAQKVDSFAARGHARWMVVAGANPREKGIHDAGFGHSGVTAATVSFEHEYSHDLAYGATMAADYAERLVACADAMKGIPDPRAFVAAMEQIERLSREADRSTIDVASMLGDIARAALARIGGGV